MVVVVVVCGWWWWWWWWFILVVLSSLSSASVGSLCDFDWFFFYRSLFACLLFLLLLFLLLVIVLAICNIPSHCHTLAYTLTMFVCLFYHSVLVFIFFRGVFAVQIFWSTKISSIFILCLALFGFVVTASGVDGLVAVAIVADAIVDVIVGVVVVVFVADSV